jgi:hypothetical protein
LIITWTDTSDPSAFVVDAIDFDVTISEQHEFSATATKHPVEAGAAVSDHVSPDPDAFSCEVMVSDTPIQIAATLMDGVTAASESVSLDLAAIRKLTDVAYIKGDKAVESKSQESAQSVSVNVLRFSSEFSRVQRTYDRLRQLRDEATFVTVITRMREYSDMVLTSYSTTKTAKDGSAATITLKFEHIRVASSETVALPPPRSRARRDAGQLPVTPPDASTTQAATTATRESALSQGISGWFGNTGTR